MKGRYVLRGELSCKCKGNRDYVHGTDVYNFFFQDINKNCIFLKGFKNISISFKKIITSKQVYYEIYRQKVNDKDANAIINFVSDNKEYYAVLKSSKSPVEKSYHFNESDITKHCLAIIDDKKIVLSKSVDFTSIEIFTAMNKKLLNLLFPLNKKWLMTRFESIEYYDTVNYETICIVMKRAVLLKLIRSDIYIDKVKIGSIYFSESI